MSATIVIFLGKPQHWLTVSDYQITERGRGFPPLVEDSQIVGVVPASETVVHQLALPGLTEAQARAAARLAVAENSVSPIALLHVAVGAEVDGERTVVALNASLMVDYLADFTTRGIDPDAIIAATLIPPRPDRGFAVANLGNETVVRGRDGAFLDDPVLTPLLTGGDMLRLESEALETAIVTAATVPEVDLRQGLFARRRGWAVDSVRLRRIAWLTAACLASLLVLPIADLVHLNAATRRINAHSLAVAQSALPGVVVTNPVTQLQERLAATGGAGGGFLSLANAVASDAKQVAGIELGAISFANDGAVQVSAHATELPDLEAFEARMVGSGLIVTSTPSVAGTGRPTREFTVRAR